MKRVSVVLLSLVISLAVLFGCGNKVEKSKKMYDEGAKLLQDGKNEEAEKIFKKAIELDPNNAKALFQLGFMHSKEPEDIEIAISYLEKGNAVDPNIEQGHYILALLYGEKGFHEHELRELNKTVELNKDNDGAHYNLGVIFAQKRLYTEAEKEFNEVLRINPKDSDAMINLGVVYVRDDKIKEAEKILEDLKKLKSKSADTLSKLIADAKKAEEVIKKALKKEEPEKEKEGE